MTTLSLLLPWIVALPEVAVADPPANPSRPALDVQVDPYELSTNSFQFPSGLRILVQPDQTEPVVSITSFVDRGSAADPPGKEGIAHFVEHLWFRSEHGDLPKIWDLLRSDLGCTLNASTAEDWTNYMTVCPSSSLEHLLRLESLRLTDTVRNVSEAAIEIEREVVRNELRMRYENTWMTAIPYLFEKLFPEGHPYQRLGIGTHDSLDNITPEDIEQFVEDNYLPDLTTIAVVGDVPENPHEQLDLIYRNFDLELLHPDLTEDDLVLVPRPGIEEPERGNDDHWLVFAMDPHQQDEPLDLGDPENPIVRVSGPPAEPPPPADQSMSTFKGPVDDPTVFIAWTMPGAYNDQQASMQMAAGYSGFLMAQRFDRDPNVKEDEVGCFLWGAKLDSRVICVIPLKPDYRADPERIAERAADQVAQMWNPDLVQSLEWGMSRQRMEALGGVLRSLDLFASVGAGRATEIGQWAHFTGSHRYHSDMMEMNMAVQPREASEFARKYLRRDRMAQIFMEPLPEDDLLDGGERGTEYMGAQEGDDVLSSSLEPEQLTPEFIAEAATPPDVSRIVEQELDNGLRVVVMPHGEAPLAQAQLIFHGGRSLGPDGMSWFATRFSRSIYNRWSAVQANIPANYDPLRFAGAWLRDRDSYTKHIGMRAPSGNLDASLWMMREAIEEMSPRMAGKRRWINERRDRLEASWGRRSGHLSRVRNEHINPGHPLTWRASHEDYDNTIRRWRRRHVVERLNRVYQPANATLLVVGLVDPDEVLEQATYYFGGWEADSDVEQGPVPELPPPNEPGEGGVLLFDHPRTTQTEVHLQCQLAPDQDQTLSAARTVLGAYLSDQAFVRLREEAGVTYGAGAGTRAYPGGTAYLRMASTVENEGTALAVQTFRDMVRDARDGKLDPDAIRLHAYNRSLRSVVGQQSNGQMSGRLRNVIAWRHSWDQLTTLGERLGQVDLETIQEAVGGCADHALITIEGPEAVIAPSLEEAGIDFQVYDWEEAGRELLREHNPRAYRRQERQREREERRQEEEDPGEGEEEETTEPVADETDADDEPDVDEPGEDEDADDVGDASAD